MDGSTFIPTVVVGVPAIFLSIRCIQGLMQFAKLSLAFLAFALAALPIISAARLGMPIYDFYILNLH